MHIWGRFCYNPADEEKVCAGASLDRRAGDACLTAIAQSSPGAIAVNASILVGYHVAGITGALISVLGTVLPPLLIISVISLFYKAFRDNPIVNMVMTGMLAGVAAVVCEVVFTMGKNVICQKKMMPIAVMLVSFAAVRFLNVNIMIVILVCGVLGALETLYHERSVSKT